MSPAVLWIRLQRSALRSILELKESLSIIIVTHNMQQAARVSDKTAFFFMGQLIEFDATDTIFNHPKLEKTRDYVNGHFG